MFGKKVVRLKAAKIRMSENAIFDSAIILAVSLFDRLVQIGVSSKLVLSIPEKRNYDE